MNNILFFIKKHGIVILFVILQIVNITLFITYNRFPNIVFGEWIFYTNLKMQTGVKNISDYLHLKEVNEKLLEENVNLRNQLNYNYTARHKGSSTKNEVVGNVSSLNTEKTNDSSIEFFKQYEWLKTEVVDLVKKQNNIFLIIRGGKNHGIVENMALVSAQGVAGNIMKVYDNYSIATTLFNEKTKIIGKVLSNNTFCALEWSELEPNILICKNFPLNTNIKIGDTIITSNYSVKYPPDLPIGVVDGMTENKQNREMALKIKPFVNYHLLSQMYIIKNQDHHILENIKSDITKE